jgi:hypothetical protein
MRMGVVDERRWMRRVPEGAMGVLKNLHLCRPDRKGDVTGRCIAG